MIYKISTALLLLNVLSKISFANSNEITPIIYGWVERVELEPVGLSLKAKLDTGAKTSSLDARNIKVVRQDGQRYVIFDVKSGNKKITRKTKRLKGCGLLTQWQTQKTRRW